MISLTEARQCVVERLKPLPEVRVPLEEAWGRVLAREVRADGDFPPMDRSMMDGYAVRGEEGPGWFRLVGEVAAGSVPRVSLKAGECVRIFTGAAVPEGGGRVVMQEDAVREREGVRLENFGDRDFIRRKGSEAGAGELLLGPGVVLGAAECAVLAQVGEVQPWVIPAPSIRHVATGSELVDPACIPGEGQIRDTNSTLLRALFRQAGAGQFVSCRVADEIPAIAAAAGGPGDLLILSGGASVGDYDFGAEVLRELGYTIHFSRVNLRPGKPLTFATRGGSGAFLVPGNPVSHFVCFHTAIRLALECLGGRPASWPAVWLELTGPVRLQPDPRETWWPARVVVEDGQLRVRPLEWSSSGNPFALSGTNALVQVNATSPAGGKALTLLLEPPASPVP